MASNNFSFVQMQANKSTFVQALLPAIKTYFEGFGIEIVDFMIESITLPEELQEYLRKNTQMNMVGDLQKFLLFQSANAIEDSAQHDGNMSGGMNIGVGMQIGNMMANQMQNAQNNQTPQSKEDVMKTLKDLGELKTAGILTDEEFDAKKKELLARL